MADVTGSIQGSDGEKGIVLNNAATEATLRLLLQSSLASNKQNVDQLKKLAKDGGIFDGAAMSDVNDNMSKLTPTVKKVGSGLDDFERGLSRARIALLPFDTALGKLTQGTAKTSDLIGSFSQLPLGIGTVASAFARLAKFQEDNLDSYQKLTNSGIGFAGSLTDIRQASADMYLTMDQLTNLMTKNSRELVLLGGSANEGAMAFRRIGKELIQSSAGKELQNLGFTTEQVNQGLIDYVAISGGRTKKDLENSSQLRASASAYMLELDRLANITGKSREQQAADLKKTMEAADIELYKATLSKEDRDRFSEAMNVMQGLLGDAGRDLVVAQFQNRAVTGEAGVAYTGLMGKSARLVAEYTDEVRRSGKDSPQSKALAYQVELANQGIKQYAGVVGSTTKIFDPIKDAVHTASVGIMAGNTNVNKLAERDAQYKKGLNDRNNSEAATAITQQNKLNEARDQFLKVVNELSQAMMPHLYDAITGITDAIKLFSTSFKGHMGELALAAGGVVIGLGLLKLALGIVGSVANGVGSIGRAITGGPSSAPAVSSSSKVPGSTVRSGVTGAIEGELAGASRGASGLLKGIAGIGTVLTLGLSAREYFDLEKKRKQGEITDEKASREKTKVVAETGGGLSGALAFATAGSVFGPLGTIVGGVVGGVVGSKIGKDIAESLTTEDKKKEKTPANDTESTRKDSTLPADIPSKDLLEGVNRLNTTMITLLKYMKDTSSNTERTYRNVENLKNKVW
jgi:hypothetical protein